MQGAWLLEILESILQGAIGRLKKVSQTPKPETLFATGLKNPKPNP